MEFINKNWTKITLGIIALGIIVIAGNLILNPNNKSILNQNSVTKIAKTELPTIISQWRPIVSRIECKWYSTDGKLAADSYGSGIIFSNSILTNEHVLKYNNQAPWTCNVTFPGTNESYTITYDGKSGTFKEIGFLKGWDLGLVMVNNPSSYLKSISGIPNYCKTRASVGDEVVILGYPSIGSAVDITATEGIISGYEDTYYITSAKVDHGNSGGAAILVKDNCYLGVPTYVVGGELESLARILDFSKYMDSVNAPAN
jgi:S1-C subfamily serine protease